MNLLLLTRAASAIALPGALGLAWLQRWNQRPASSHPRPRVEEALLRRPTRCELRRMIADGDSLADLDLRNVRLQRADLRGRVLTGSDLTKVDLRNAVLAGADLSETVLDFADLSGADLTHADLQGASLVETSFWNADLCGADLRSVRNLVMANVKRATFDRHTSWPGRLDPTTLGAVATKGGRNR